MSIDMGNVVAAVWVMQDGDSMTLAIDSVNDRVPYDRRLLARALRKLGDELDTASNIRDAVGDR